MKLIQSDAAPKWGEKKERHAQMNESERHNKSKIDPLHFDDAACDTLHFRMDDGCVTVGSAEAENVS